MKPELLLVDDDRELRTQLRWALDETYEVHLAEDRPSALAACDGAAPPVVLLDLGLPPLPNSVEEGLLTMREILAHSPRTKVIVISGQSDRHNALQAIAEGAYDFLCKPIDMEELAIILRRAFYLAQLEADYEAFRNQDRPDTFEQMLGTSVGMHQVFEAIRKVATTDAPVLMLGESGTGKEMAALAIHRRSDRREGPFVAINCGAIPETLLESELFGHEKGAFTGAHAQRTGRIEMARDGTLFLDEIGDLPPALQVKLLRFLQDRTIERVGGRQVLEVDARVLAATHRDLQEAMGEGAFREDLFYRLAVVQIRIPPLRERVSDVPLLAMAFLGRYAAEYERKATGFAAKAMEAMAAYRWPGNVRELENRIKRAVIMSEGRGITPEDLELTESMLADPGPTLREVREVVEREAIQRALIRHQGKISRAAAELDVSRPTLYDLIQRLGIERPTAVSEAS